MLGTQRAAVFRLALITAGLAALAIVPAASLDRLPEICHFQRLFDHACLGCGLTRSISAWLHGDLAGARVFHPAGPWVAFLALTLAVTDATRLVWGRRAMRSVAARSATS